MQRRHFFEMSAMAAIGSAVMPSEAQTQQSARNAKITEMKPMAGGIVPADQIRACNLGLGEVRIIVDVKRSRGTWWMAQARLDPGFMTTLHVHAQADEQFYVVEGVLSFYMDGKNGTMSRLANWPWYRVERRTRRETPALSQCALSEQGIPLASISGSLPSTSFENDCRPQTRGFAAKWKEFPSRMTCRR